MAEYIKREELIKCVEGEEVVALIGEFIFRSESN